MDKSSYTAAVTSAAWRDMTHFGRFTVGGADAAALLHHLSTNDIKRLKIGEGCDGALVSSKARLLDIVTIFRMAPPEDGPTGPRFLVITSPNRRELFKPHAQRFVLYRQDIAIDEMNTEHSLIGLFGPRSLELIASLLNLPAALEPNKLHKLRIEGAEITLARTHRLPHSDGFFLWGDRTSLVGWMNAHGVPAVDGDTYNVLRVEAGLPAAGFEITEEINPWEAGLGAMISLHKGCYNGQEVIARLNTYQKVKQNLRGLRLAQPVPMGESGSLHVAGKRAGGITSSVESPRFGPIGLSYLRNAYAAAGTRVDVLREGAEVDASFQAVVCELPFT